jgi:hypothetical protein
MERRFSVWALAALMVLAVGVVPAAANWTAWDNAAESGANFLDLWVNANGPPVAFLDSDTVDSPVVPGLGLAAFDDWGCIGTALRTGEGVPIVLPPAAAVYYPRFPLAPGAGAGNYSGDAAIETGLAGIFPIAGGVPTHGAMRHLDLSFMANSSGVGGDAVANSARAAIQWGEMKASGVAGHNGVPGWPSAYWGVFDAYANLAALGNHFDNLNSAAAVLLGPGPGDARVRSRERHHAAGHVAARTSGRPAGRPLMVQPELRAHAVREGYEHGGCDHRAGCRQRAVLRLSDAAGWRLSGRQHERDRPARG